MEYDKKYDNDIDENSLINNINNLKMLIQKTEIELENDFLKIENHISKLLDESVPIDKKVN